MGAEHEFGVINHLAYWAQVQPEAPAIIMAADGSITTFSELEAASNQGSQLLRSLGLKRGDRFAIWSGTNPRFLEIAWAMQRSGLYLVLIPSRLTADDAVYIVKDSEAKVVVLAAALGRKADDFLAKSAEECPALETAYSLCGEIDGVAPWEEATARMPTTPIADPSFGRPMLYSSGTTGAAKGVWMDLPSEPFDDLSRFLEAHRFTDVRPGTVFAATAPLYHSGPITMSLSEQALGAAVLLFEKFEAEPVLAALARYNAARAQFVPTMFVRMLKLAPEIRARYDLSALKQVVHSAAPCPLEVKRAMIDWWGPVFTDIYGGAEGVGFTMIDSHEWLRKPGSVGNAVVGQIHVCDNSGDGIPAGERGTIYFSGSRTFEYKGDPEKTRRALNPKHPDWATYGDVGYVDEDGYLFLTDRLSFKIISGGNNIYPQEIEDVLIQHPAVRDVAALGVPHEDMGEVVKAVVELQDHARADPELEHELIEFCKARLAIFKCPRSIDFTRALPRDPSGKLFKRELREKYWGADRR